MMNRSVVATISMLFISLQVQAGAAYTTKTVAENLVVISAIEFLPDGRALVAERPKGTISIVDMKSGVKQLIAGLPKVYTNPDAGMNDVILHPDFTENQLVYFSYSEKTDAGGVTVVDRARLTGDRLTGRERLFTAIGSGEQDWHYGGRLVLQNGYLFITVGDHHERHRAQELSNHLGKIIRLHEDGSIPDDNPYIDTEGALEEIWTIGHRNPQGLALHPENGELWSNEHGPRGGDEINLIVKGNNYGWPVITLGFEYDGGAVGDGIEEKEGLQRPVYNWTPSIAPSDMMFYTGDMFPEWHGSVFIGAMGKQHLNRTVIQNGKVVLEERLLGDQGWRVRAIAQGPEGAIYLGVDNGIIVKVFKK